MSIKLDSASGSITLVSEDGTGNANVTVPRAGFSSSSGKLVKFTEVYNSNTASSGGNHHQLATDESFYYKEGSMIKGQFTKSAGTSIVVAGTYSAMTTGSNPHDFYVWVGDNVGGHNHARLHVGFDPHRMAGPTGTNKMGHAFNFTIPASLGLGAGTFWACAVMGRGDSGGHDVLINYNPQSNGGNTDTTNENTRSQMHVMEVTP